MSQGGFHNKKEERKKIFKIRTKIEKQKVEINRY